MNLIDELLQHRSAGLAQDSPKRHLKERMTKPVVLLFLCKHSPSVLMEHLQCSCSTFFGGKEKRKKKKRRKMCKTSTRVLNITFSESQTGVEAGKAPTQHSVDNEEVGSDRRTH